MCREVWSALCLSTDRKAWVPNIKERSSAVGPFRDWLSGSSVLLYRLRLGGARVFDRLARYATTTRPFHAVQAPGVAPARVVEDVRGDQGPPR